MLAIASLIGTYQAELRRRFALETRLSSLNAELEALAFTDSLTGLANRRLFFDRLDQALVRTRRKRCWGGVLLLDLNRFKELNDTYGHEAGDSLLVEVASRLQANVRASDTVARLGGDEFVILLEDIGFGAAEATANAAEVVAKLQRSLLEPYDLNGARFLGSASIGYAIFDAEPDDDAVLILRRADSSMYELKRMQSGMTKAGQFGADK
jgi:diguanylate cyclase (GGDEF)-like protein